MCWKRALLPSLLVLPLFIAGNHALAESDAQKALVKSAFLYKADRVLLHHATNSNSLDFIHHVVSTQRPDISTGGLYASRFDATGQRLIETKIGFGVTCAGSDNCIVPLRALVLSPKDYVVTATDSLGGNNILLSFINRSTLAIERTGSIAIPPGETIIDIASNGTDAFFLLTGAQQDPSHRTMFGQLRVRKYSLAGAQIGPIKSIVAVLPWPATQTTLLSMQPDDGAALIIPSSATDTVYLRMQESVVNAGAPSNVLESHLAFAKIELNPNSVDWVFRITNFAYPSTPATGNSPNIKSWSLDGSGGIVIAGQLMGGDRPLPAGHTFDGLPFIEDVKGVLAWHLRADGTLDQYCAWRIPGFEGLSLTDYTLSNIELQPFRDGALISADVALSVGVDRGGNAAIPALPAATSVGAVMVARLSAGGTLVWSDVVSRSDQTSLDPRCCALRPQDFWSVNNSTADIISDSSIRVTAQSSRVASYYTTAFGGFSYINGEQVAADLAITNDPPLTQFLTQQYLMGWTYSSLNYLQVADTPN